MPNAAKVENQVNRLLQDRLLTSPQPIYLHSMLCLPLYDFHEGRVKVEREATGEYSYSNFPAYIDTQCFSLFLC
jgi:hypothetical protein